MGKLVAYEFVYLVTSHSFITSLLCVLLKILFLKYILKCNKRNYWKTNYIIQKHCTCLVFDKTNKYTYVRLFVSTKLNLNPFMTTLQTNSVLSEGLIHALQLTYTLCTNLRSIIFILSKFLRVEDQKPPRCVYHDGFLILPTCQT